MNKHTPGPWLFRKDDSWTIFADGQSIMGNERYYPWVPDDEADWRLIAAAPDLLAELEAMTRLFMDRYPAKGLDGEAQTRIDAARAAITKATGEQP